MATYRQDRAPPGGYKDIDWTRIYRKRINGWKLLGGILAMKAVGLVWLFNLQKKQRLELCEEFDGRISILPFMTAETDRLVMKQCLQMRNEEKEIMKDVPDWKVGTWKGENAFHDEQHLFDAMLKREKNVHEEVPRFREKVRTWMGFSPRLQP